MKNEITTLSSIALREHPVADTISERNDCVTDNLYKEIIRSFGVEMQIDQNYIYAGDSYGKQGWIIDISVIKNQMTALLHTVLPLVIPNGYPFRVIRQEELFTMLMEGNLGYTELGKALSILVIGEGRELELVKKLLEVTHGFNGPAVPTGKLLGNNIYVRFGTIRPIISVRQNGESVRCMHDASGNLVVEPLSTPFQLPVGVSWPFSEITSPDPVKVPKLLNYAYKLSTVLKYDAKGKVYKGFYFKKLWLIKACIIKEGKRHMFADSAGRDIKDRLHWQYYVYQSLKGHIPMPEIFDCFEENGDSFLAMEYVKGPSLQSVVHKTYRGNVWQHLAAQQKKQLLDILITIVNIIERLHSKGFVHRDITPTNFLLPAKNQVCLIDMELAFDIRNKHLATPFQLGTPGYMSPQQKNKEEPDYSDDIYALGGLMITVFTNLPTMKFDTGDINELQKNVARFIDNKPILSIITGCMNPARERRPTLADIREALKNFKNNQTESNRFGMQSINLLEPSLRKNIQLAINGLSEAYLLSKEKKWTSKSTNIGMMGNELLGRSLEIGLQNGLAGVLFILSRSMEMGFDITGSSQSFEASWNHILETQKEETEHGIGGLYKGLAGVSIAYAAGVRSNLLENDEEKTGLLMNWLSKPLAGYNIAGGSSGQGLAILHCADLLPAAWVSKRLSELTIRFIKEQKIEGYWNRNENDGKKKAPTLGFSYGLAGILTFLILYAEKTQDKNVLQPIEKGLSFLKKNISNSINRYLLKDQEGASFYDMIGFSNGIAGIMLPFIRAYKLLQKEEYKNFVEETFAMFPQKLTLFDFTLDNGSTGIGEIYLEAARIFGHNDWMSRGMWISETLLRTVKRTPNNNIFWRTVIETSPTADLFNGLSGLIHYQMRTLYPKNLEHPLLPF